MKDMQRTVQTFELEIEQLDVDIENSQNEIDKSSESIKSLKAEMVEIQDETSSNETTSEQLRNQLDKENEILAARNEELTELSDLHEKKSNALVELNLQVQKLTHENEKFAKEQQASQQIVADYEKNNDWIIDQRDSFGQPNTPFDYTQLNIPDARKELKQLRTNHDSMRKKINNRVMNMIDK
jgi:structural maintenance of chromosome 2